MLFNSLEFLIFLPTVFLLYWFVFQKNLRVQNLLLLISSYVFYGWWDYRFLSLIFLSTVVDYFVGLKIHTNDEKKKKKFFLCISIFFNLGLLGFFKYFNFFIDSWIDLLSAIGYEQKSTWTLNLILPVGISFYTFQTMSYSLDIYNGKLKPTKNFIFFASFVSFFPQLVAGPIERASNLLPQFRKKRKFLYQNAIDGMRLILMGFFKKIVIADNCAIFVNQIYDNMEYFSGSTLLIGAVLFSFQIYGDFSGYSDIAIGTARLFGFKLLTNFKFPYLSRDIAEFWRRWHISLSSWFRDYVYIPMGGSRVVKYKKYINVLIIFIISGFWHGANYTFIIWGFLHSLFFIPLLYFDKNRHHIQSISNKKLIFLLKDVFKIILTFFLVTIAWIFFRSPSVDHAFKFINAVFSYSLFTNPIPEIWAINTGYQIVYLCFFIIVSISLEWTLRNREHGLDISHLNKFSRWVIYYFLTISCMFMEGIGQQFIYFQF